MYQPIAEITSACPQYLVSITIRPERREELRCRRYKLGRQIYYLRRGHDMNIVIDYSQYKITDTAFHSRSSRDRLIKLDETMSRSL